MKTNTRWSKIWPSLLLFLPILLAACGGSTSGGTGNGSGQTLNVLMSKNTSFPTVQQQWMQQIGTEFKQKYGATIKWDTFTSSSDEQTKIQTSVISGSGPDVFNLGTTFIPTAQATKGFQVLSDDDWKAVGGRAKFVQEQLSMSGSSPDQQIGVPLMMEPFGMVYNKTMFQKAGITTPPTTWTEFVQDAQKLTDTKDGVYGTTMDPSDTYDPWKIWWTFDEQMGGSYLSSDLKTAQMNTPEAVQATQFWFDWATKYHIVDPNSMSWKANDATQAFINSKAAMQIMVSPTIVPSLENSSLKGQYAFAPLPTVPYGMTQRPANGKEASTIVSGYDFAIASYTNEKDLALKFINMVTDVPHQLQWSKDFGDMPANAQAAQQLSASDPQAAAFIKAEAGATPTPFSGSWGALEVSLGGVSSKLANNVATNHYNDSDVKPLLDQANQQIQSQLK